MKPKFSLDFDFENNNDNNNNKNNKNNYNFDISIFHIPINFESSLSKINQFSINILTNVCLRSISLTELDFILY